MHKKETFEFHHNIISTNGLESRPGNKVEPGLKEEKRDRAPNSVRIGLPISFILTLGCVPFLSYRIHVLPDR